MAVRDVALAFAFAAALPRLGFFGLATVSRLEGSGAFSLSDTSWNRFATSLLTALGVGRDGLGAPLDRTFGTAGSG